MCSSDLEEGAGIDVRADLSAVSPYQLLRNARAAARAEERSTDPDQDTDSTVAFDHWREVKRLCLHCLMYQTKDFQIAAWLSEALIRVDGLPGLTAGAELIAGLLDRYWDSGLPRPDDDAPAGEELLGRGLPLQALAGQDGGLSGLEGTIVQQLYRLPLFRLEGQPVCLHDWQAAEQRRELGNAELRQKRRQSGIADPVVLRRAARADSTLQYVAGEAGTAAFAWAAMVAKIDQRFEFGLYDMHRVSDVLKSLQDIARTVADPSTTY